MSRNDNFDGAHTMGDSVQAMRNMAATLAAECERLREDLALSRQELAQVRLRQEDNEEQLARLPTVEAERDTLAQVLARHLSNPSLDILRVGGVRGWIARRLLRPAVQRARERDPLVTLIEDSGLFDAGWYICTYSDVAESGDSPAMHYLHHGAAEGRAASPRFDTAFYLARYPDVKESGVNPLVHYLQVGQGEGRLPVQPFYERLAAETGSEAEGPLQR